MIEVYTGNGKGKTTAALGLAFRAVGQGLRVCMIQFMKAHKYGEVKASKSLPNFELVQFGRKEFVSKKNPEKIDVELARKGLANAKEIIGSKKYDMVILDEINVAIDFRLIPVEEVIELIKDQSAEIILTGRYADDRIIKIADYVSEIKEIKHPYKKGETARKGIEY